MQTEPHGRADGDLRSRAYSRVRDWLLDGEYALGDAVQESELARRLQMSRTPVRGALDMLVHDGLLGASRSGGYFVEPLTPRRLREVFQAREALECFAVWHGSVPEPGSRMLTLTTLFELYIPQTEELSVTERILLSLADSAFHGAMVATLSNRIISSLHERQLTVRTEQLHGLAWEDVSRTVEAARGHLRIARALVQGSREDAEAELLGHIQRGLEYVTEAVARDYVPPRRRLVHEISALLEEWLAAPGARRPEAGALIAAARSIEETASGADGGERSLGSVAQQAGS